MSADPQPANDAPRPKGRLRHIAITVPDLERAATFYKGVFGLAQVGSADTALARGIFLSDGVVNLALLQYKTDEGAGAERGKDYHGLHHIGFWVDDLDAAGKAIEAGGGHWWMGDPTGKSYYEVKYRDPNGVVVDVTESGWRGASKAG